MNHQEAMNIDSFDSLKLDKRVKGIVIRLREAGFETIMSCQGGPGHAYKKPRVGILTTAVDKVKEFLKKNRLKNIEVIKKEKQVFIVGDNLLDL